MIEKAQEAIKNQNYEVALRLFSEVVKANPRNAIAFQGLAEVYYMVKNFQAAKESSERALEINPSLSKTYTILAQSKYHLGDGIEICYDIAEKAYKLAPESIETIYCFGAFSIISGKIEQGISLSNKILSIDPDSYLAYSNLHAAYSRLKKPEKIYDILKKMYRSRPSIGTGFLVVISFMNLPLPKIVNIIVGTLGFWAGIILGFKFLLVFPAFYAVLGITIGIYDFTRGTKKAGLIRIIVSVLFLLILFLIIIRLK